MYIGVLKRKVVVLGKDFYASIITDKEEQKAVFREHHNSVIGGHSGACKTTQKIMERCYWPGISKDIKDWVMIKNNDKKCS